MDSVLVVGLGYVGYPLAKAFATAGIPTIGVDIDPERLRVLLAQESRFKVTAEMARVGSGAMTFVVTVPTPLKAGKPDLSAVFAATQQVAAILQAGDMVVYESTVAPGTTEGPVRQALETASGLSAGTDFALVYSPERISPAQREDLLRTPKVVGGLTRMCTQRGIDLYEAAGIPTISASSCSAAEAAKCIENAQRLLTIGLANETAPALARLGVNPFEVFDLASSKPYGFTRTRPGIGIGGHCIAVDSTYLQARFEEVDCPSSLLEAGLAQAALKPVMVANEIGASGFRSVALLGAAYKPNCDDVREAPSSEIAACLVESGRRVCVFDPLVLGVSMFASTDVLDAFDLVVMLVGHDAWDWEALWNYSRRRPGRVWDYTGRLSPDTFRFGDAPGCI